jgi:DNA repair protein RadD
VSIALRAYQSTAIEELLAWWDTHPGQGQIPIAVLPTGAGKSIIIADMVRQLFALWPEYHPRTLVIVPSKELAEQNAEKLATVLPSHLRIGYYSASVGKKDPTADVIVATIGSVAKQAHILGNICCVLVDECHLISPDGAGQYRSFLIELARYCQFRTAGLTATPFRGNGIWLTDGKAPLFTGIATEVRLRQLLDDAYLSPLVRPVDVLEQIDASGVEVSKATGDYDLHQLSEVVDAYIESAARQSVRIAFDRKKWIAFCPTVANAEKLARALNTLGVVTQVVTGETPKAVRESLIGQFRAGKIRCLVTVLALATGFDVPDVDCILWLRPTKSPVLYVQGAGRGMRIAPGKKDCLWLDFSDTTARLGPLDKIRGRAKRSSNPGMAPFAVCDDCGAQVRPASLLVCPECGFVMREEEAPSARKVSDAAVLASQVRQKINRYEIDRVQYAKHEKAGSPPSLRVEYWAGYRCVAREWVCLSHAGYALAKARSWFSDRSPAGYSHLPGSVDQALEWLDTGFELRQPSAIVVNETAKFPEIVSYEWNSTADASDGAARDVIEA